MQIPGLNTLETAKVHNLIQLTVWVFRDDLNWLQKELERIGSNPARIAMIVGDSHKYALFVNCVSGSNTETYDKPTMSVVINED